MGACGCGDYHGGLKFLGPRGVVYTIEIYPGCSDCSAPAGITLHRFADKEDIDWHEHDEPVPFYNYEGKVTDKGSATYSIPLLDPNAVRKQLHQLFTGATIATDGDEFSFKDYVEDGCRDEFDEALTSGFVLPTGTPAGERT